MAKAKYELPSAEMIEWEHPGDEVVALFREAIEAHREANKHGSRNVNRTRLNVLRQLLDDEEDKQIKGD